MKKKKTLIMKIQQKIKSDETFVAGPYPPIGNTVVANSTYGKKLTNGYVYLKNKSAGTDFSKNVYVCDYGDTTVNLINNNSSLWFGIKKDGYSPVTGEEWICNSGCTTSNKKYNQNEYSFNNTDDEFCDTTTDDCIVDISPNYRKNKLTVKFNANGGTIKEETTSSAGNTYNWRTDSNGIVS